MYHRHGLTLLALALFLSPCQAHFLFVRILPQAEAGRAAEIFFSDHPDAGDSLFLDKITGTKLWAQTEPGKFESLPVAKLADRLRSVLPGQPSLGVIGECTYGVLARPKKKAFLLRHFPKAISGDPKFLNGLQLKSEIPLEIRAQFDDGLVHFTAYHQGKPIPKAEFNFVGAKSEPLIAGEDGKVSWKPVPGSIGVYTGHTTPVAGTFGDQKYDEIRDFTMLTFTYPLLKTAGDPEAYKLFQGAVAQRAAWQKFPGFSAELEAHVDGKSLKAEVKIASNGDVDFKNPEDAVGSWVKDRLDSLVLHRLANPATKSDAIPIVYFGDHDANHPLGRLVVFEGGKFASSYRVKDRQLMTVNRHLGKSNMTITILENDANAEGKTLPRSYTVQYWDALTGQLKRTEAVHERWSRVDGLDVPVSHRSLEASPTGLSVKSLKLSQHKILK